MAGDHDGAASLQDAALHLVDPAAADGQARVGQQERVDGLDQMLPGM